MSGRRATQHPEGRAARRLREDLRHVMASVQGRRFVHWLIVEHAGVMAETFSGSPHHTLHAEGRRSVGVQLLRMVEEHCPRDWALAVQEALHRQAEEQREGADGAESEEP